MNDDLRPNEQSLPPHVHAEGSQVVVDLPGVGPKGEPAYLRMSVLEAVLFATSILEATNIAKRG